MTEPAPDRPVAFRRRVLVNTLSTGVANIWAIVVGLVTLPLLLHGMGAASFGTWVLVQTFSAVTGWISLADLGVGTATTRNVATKAARDDRDGVTTTVTSALSVFVGVGALCALVLVTVGRRFLPALFHTPHALRADLRFALALFAVQVVVDLVTEGCEACLEGLQRVDLSRGADAVRRTAVAAATAAVALAGGGLKGVAAASLAASVGGMAVAVVLLARHLPAGGRRPSPAIVRELLAYGRTVAVLRPLGVVHRSVDRVVVGGVFGPSAVALVEVATQMMNGADAILSAASYAVIPSAAWLDSRGDRTTLVELLERGTKYSLLATLPVVGLGIALAGPIVHLWVGARYSAAPGLAAVALLYIALVAPLQVGSNLLLAVGEAGAVLRSAAAAIVVNVALSVTLVHVTGIVGVFQATLLAACVLLPPLTRSVLREVGISLRQFLATAVTPAVAPLVALGAVSGACVAAPLPDVATLVLGALGGFGAFVVVALRFSMSRSELAELRRLAARTPATAP
ncbi:MAG TPA: lipopolysaccharide biosynthesis protein [Acidimicrobiales bacterium]|nr:lipopolysaccharide biosynthesis protein [Acidimicrobiales bacterium]